jgi:hypothetical protein
MIFEQFGWTQVCIVFHSNVSKFNLHNHVQIVLHIRVTHIYMCLIRIMNIFLLDSF